MPPPGPAGALAGTSETFGSSNAPARLARVPPRLRSMLARPAVGARAGRQPSTKRKVHHMLVLTRKSNQSIMIGDEIEVSVLSVMGEKVRIGIQAPQEVPVFRKEIYLEIHREAARPRAEDDGGTSRSASHARRARGELRAARAPAGARQPLGARASAEQQVQRAEHDHRHDHRGQDQREHEQPRSAASPACCASRLRAWRRAVRRCGAASRAGGGPARSL